MQHRQEQSPEAEFGRRTRLLRDAIGWSQTGLATRLEAHGIKVDGTAITRLERGTRAIRLNEAVAIAYELGDGGAVDAMLRPPVVSLAEQLKQARTEETAARLRHVSAAAEHEAARARLDELRAGHHHHHQNQEA